MSVRDLLIVEDEPVVRRAARRILKSGGIEVDLAADATAARTCLGRYRYRVLLCDLMLPGSSGFDLIRLAREIHPTIQAVIVTGYATLDNAIGAFRLGAFDFIPKPFDPGEIRGVVDRALAFHQLAAAGRALPSIGEADGSTATTYRLGLHAWARIEPENSVTLGAAETFSRVLRRIDSIAMLALGDRSTQGRRLARIISDGGAVHRVWAPLSGPIVAVNEKLSTDPDLLLREPSTGGWLVKVLPDSLEEELIHLRAARVLGASREGGRPD